MTAGFGFSRADLSAVFLRSAILAFAIMVLASPARGDTLDLICTFANEGGSDRSVRILIDTQSRGVEEIWENGRNRYVASAISNQSIKYSDVSAGRTIETTIDRIAGTMLKETTRGFQLGSQNRAACRRATQKF